MEHHKNTKSVVTYIFGTNAELLRDPIVIDPSIDYICVTDQTDLHSNIWRIVYDPISTANCQRDKMPLVKYNPFKYTDASRIIVMDGTLQISGSLDRLFTQLENVGLLIKRHPQRSNLLDELDAWIKIRNINPQIIQKFNAMSLVDNIPLTNNFLIESCVIGYQNNNYIKQLCSLVLSYMEFLGDDGKLCMTNQCPFTYLTQKLNVQYSWLNQAEFATRYKHNSWIMANR